MQDTKRFKLIADYPNCSDPVGSIFTMSSNPQYDESESYEAFPHLFKKLEWWEERSLDELPRFMRHINTNDVYRFLSITPVVNQVYVNLQRGDIKTREPFSNLLPATEQEYNEQNMFSIELALRARYQLLADYPGNTDPVGYIYNTPLESADKRKEWCEEKERFPQIFKRLEWWEYRTGIELPFYMKYADNPDMVFRFLNNHEWTPGKVWVEDGEKHRSWEYLKNMFPATEQEFKDQPKYRG